MTMLHRFLLPLTLFSTMLFADTALDTMQREYRYIIYTILFILFAILFLSYIIIKKQMKLKKDTQEQKEAFKTLFDKSHDGILLIEDGKFVDCNESILRILRMDSKEKLLNMHPSQLSPKYQPDGQSSFEKANEMMQIALEQGFNHFEWMHLRADGEMFWAEIVLTKINLNGKDLIHVVWRDIDERKQLEEKIITLNQELETKVEERTNEQKMLLSLFDKGESVLFKWNNDSNWSVNYVSESIQKVLGYEPDDFLTHKVVYANCIHPDDLATVSEELESAIKAQKEYFEHNPYRIFTKDGEAKWVHDSTVIVRNRSGEITHFLGYITDITDIKEKDRQLLQQAKLAQMGEMISMIAHQWRQPLNAISATASNLSLKLMTDEGLDKRYCLSEIDLIQEYTQHLSKTINDFRSFFKENKEQHKIMLHDVIEETLKIVNLSLKNRNITLQTHYKDTTPIQTYASELKQVLLNLIINAEDALMEKEIENPKITIISKNDDSSHTIIIKDNAGGIPKEAESKIFEPYFSTKLEKDGTGLGLYMSKKIIEEHCGGKLEATNDREGAVFTITL
jgi:PAS domain S-box-containing protein